MVTSCLGGGRLDRLAHLINMDGIMLDPTIVAPVVRRAAAGDREAFARIVAAYHPDLVRIAYMVGGCRHDIAEDAAQSAWAIAWCKLGSLREPERVKGWLMTVAANEARRMIRHDRPRVVEIEAADRQVTCWDPDAAVARADLAALIRRLSAEDRQLLGLRYGAGLPAEEIASLSGRTGSSVRNHLARVLARLRRELTDD
jgi:RNA polymerase sigma factor (sigma-70 family)